MIIPKGESRFTGFDDKIISMYARGMTTRDIQGHLKEIFIACVDGLKGFPEAIESVFPKIHVQLCIVHMVRYSQNYVFWKQRKEVADDLKTIYQAPSVEMAELNLDIFASKWDASHPTIAKSWRNNWERIIPQYSYPTEIRKAIYTTNL